ncbi:aftiphilin isoform X2 [Protopterus annectens]|uniref:aftiphilin isoform X2 n=1 Tax=Protopterus annectens TaxID=7888 RepID=UPI001CFA5107|nr:aftiphilin isoform X2 [Protopterus annectens]
MEPDIIPMYSSSPPPLDDGAEDEDDEFGDFGGFSEVSTSSAVFGDLASSGFTNSTEDFIPSKSFLAIHDYSSNVHSFASFSTVKAGECSDFSVPVCENTNSFVASTSTEMTKSSKSVPECTTNKEDKQKVVEESEIITSNCLTTNIISQTDVTALTRGQDVGLCRSDELAYTEVVTNGFATFDSRDSQGTEDLDSTSDSKALKTVSTLSTGLSLGSTPSPVEDLSSDFSSFQTAEELADRFASDELGHKLCKGLDEGATKLLDNITNGCNDASFVGHIITSTSDNNEGVVDNAFKQCCSLEHTKVLDDYSVKQENTRSVIDFETCNSESVPSVSLDSLPHTAADTETRGEECGHKCRTLHMDMVEVSSTVMSTSQEEEKNIDSDEKVDEFCDSENAGNVSSSSVLEENCNVGTLNVPHSFPDEVQVQVMSVDPANMSPRLHGLPDDYGDFEHVTTVGDEEFADFNQSTSEQLIVDRTESVFSKVGIVPTEQSDKSDGEFGDFNSVPVDKPLDDFAAFQEGATFAAFSSAAEDHTTDWNAFGNEEGDDSSWVAFGDEHTAAAPEEDVAWQPTRTKAASVSDSSQVSRAETAALTPHQDPSSLQCDQKPQPAAQVSLLSRIERVLQLCFPLIPYRESEEEITSLKQLLHLGEKTKEEENLRNNGVVLDLWMELQDIHEAYGLRYQWGGSSSNKKLLCSLGIDTRNILFTGNKKQPVIVPMYAAGLGMLEPTKEPMKPISAAEKIASLGQVLPASPEMNNCTAEQIQESLPPVQFDWSSSGLTNPLDASGGSTLLNLDFFGPVEDSSNSTATTIPGVDPELYELTTAKLETASTTNRVTDAFARLMSTVEKASTSARKLKKEENLGEEAAKVIASLPDLSFMHAKVLMFPATLTPSASCHKSD